jgi:hypothetical protein
MSMTFEEALEYIYKVVKCREQDKAKCNGCESCSYNFKFGWTYKAEKAIAQYYEERRRQSEQTPAQPEERTEKRTETHACDLISRQAAIDTVVFGCGGWIGLAKEISKQLKRLPSVQPEPERTMEEFMYGQDMGNPEDGSL